MTRSTRWAWLLTASFAIAACGDDDSQCTVQQQDGGEITIRCTNGTNATIPAPSEEEPTFDGGLEGCSVSRTEQTVTIQCGEDPEITFPIATEMDGGTAGGLDGGTDGSTTSADGAATGCVVSEQEGGITISCADGTKASIPGNALPPLGSLKVIGATTASCGTCHDSDRARAHFTVMTVNDEQGLPVETCGTCHNETSIEPVSRVHARPEFEAPGLRVALGAPTVDETTRKITVRMTFTETGGAAIPNRTGMSVSMVIAKVESTQSATGATIVGPYRSLLSRNVTQQNTPSFPLDGGTPRMVSQPTAENTTSGAFVEVTPGSGVWDYTTAYALPSGFDQAATYALAVYATRTVNNVRYVGNAERFFIPGSDVAQPTPRTVVNGASCANCHNPLQAHGGSRQDVQLCLTCHTQGAIDPESGNSIDFNVMIHRIHSGKDLPSVKAGRKYQIIGNALSVNDWSHAGFPQPIANCQVCHTASDSDRWVTNGTREACTSCHDNISEPNVHPIPLQPTTNCGNSVCHAPTVEAVSRDAREAHVVSLNTPTAPVLDLKILSITAGMDSAPVVRFSAYTGTRQSGAGPVDGGTPLGTPITDVAALSLLEAFVNGPNSGFVQNGNTLKRFPKDQLVSLAAGAAGEFSFSLPKTTRELFDLSADSEDEAELTRQSFTLSLRGQYDPTPGAAPDNDRIDMLRNPSAPFSPAGTPSPRKAIVSTDNCNKCHGELTAHGGGNLAKAIDQCVMCHTGSLDTRVRQGANKIAGPTRSLRLSTLVHRIHGGAKANEPYVLFGFSAMPPYPQLDFSDIGYPGDLRSCTTCHLSGTYFLPLPEGDPPTRTVSLDSEGKVIGP